MGRKRNILIREFFIYNKEVNANVCKICSSKFIGENVTNLRRHMVCSHFEVYQEELAQGQNNSIQNYGEGRKKKFMVEMSEKDIKDACLEFATIQSQPLSFFDSRGFKALSRPLFDGLQMDRITSQNVHELVEKKYIEMKNHIINLTKGQLFSIKMDTATRHGRSVLGINLQMIENNRLVVYTLSVKEIRGRQTAETLKEELYKVLDEFEISPNQVYTITTDNGRNMLKAVDLVSSNVENSSDSDSEGEDILNPDVFQNTTAISIRCAAHTLQLAVKDFFEEDQKKALIDRSRHVVKTLRTPLLRSTLKMLGLTKPKIDVPTRWNSTYEMLQSLLKCKDICSQHLKKPITNVEWESIEDLVITLKPVYETTLELQKKQLLMGDFYKTWLILKASINTNNTESSKRLLISIEKRESQLINNDVINSARFLDPRFRRTLNSEEKLSTKQHIKKLVCKLITIKQRNKSSTTSIVNINPSSSIQNADESTNQSSSSLLRQTLSMLEVDSSSEDETENEMSRDIISAYAQIENYRPPKEDVDINLLNYWHEQKYNIPFLKQLAYIIHAVPATQVTVERAFSALRLILNDQRCNLSDEKLRSIMFVKLNQSSFN